MKKMYKELKNLVLGNNNFITDLYNVVKPVTGEEHFYLGLDIEMWDDVNQEELFVNFWSPDNNFDESKIIRVFREYYRPYCNILCTDRFDDVFDNFCRFEDVETTDWEGVIKLRDNIWEINERFLLIKF